MDEPPRLLELQRRLRELIARHGDGSPGSAEALERAAADLPIRGDDRLSAGERLAIYAEMYPLRVREALEEDFPGTARAAAPRFETLVGAYLAAYPTDDPSLRAAGRHLASFLAAREDFGPPWIAELAALEWATIEAFDARDEAPLEAGALRDLPTEGWPDLRLAPIAALRVLEVRHPVDEIRERLLRGEPVEGVREAPVRLRVWRQGPAVFFRRIDEDEARALDRLDEGATFGDLCADLAGDREASAAAERAAALLGRWLADEILIALPSGGPIAKDP